MGIWYSYLCGGVPDQLGLVYLGGGMMMLGEGNGTLLQFSCLENLMDGGAWWAAVHRVAKNRTRLSDFTFTFHFHALEKEMATPMFLPGESQGRWSLVGCRLWGRSNSSSKGEHSTGQPWDLLNLRK